MKKYESITSSLSQPFLKPGDIFFIFQTNFGFKPSSIVKIQSYVRLCGPYLDENIHNYTNLNNNIFNKFSLFYIKRLLPLPKKLLNVVLCNQNYKLNYKIITKRIKHYMVYKGYKDIHIKVI